MRIGIASDDGVHVAAHTGRCRGFVIFEVQGGSAERVEYRENTFTAHGHGPRRGTGHGSHHEPGTGRHSHEELLQGLADCRVLVTRGLGPRLVMDLATRDIDAYVCEEDGVDAAALLYARGALPRAGGTGCHGA